MRWASEQVVHSHHTFSLPSSSLSASMSSSGEERAPDFGASRMEVCRDIANRLSEILEEGRDEARQHAQSALQRHQALRQRVQELEAALAAQTEEANQAGPAAVEAYRGSRQYREDVAAYRDHLQATANRRAERAARTAGTQAFDSAVRICAQLTNSELLRQELTYQNFLDGHYNAYLDGRDPGAAVPVSSESSGFSSMSSDDETQ